MSNGNPHIIANVKISDTGGTDNELEYGLTHVEGLDITEEPRTTEVEDGQTVQDGFDNSFSFRTYKMEILDDAHVQHGATIPTGLSRLVFVGASGASTKTIDGLRISARKVFDGNRDAAEVTATRTSATSVINLS